MGTIQRDGLRRLAALVLLASAPGSLPARAIDSRGGGYLPEEKAPAARHGEKRAVIVLAPAEGCVISGVAPVAVDISAPGLECIELFVDETLHGCSRTSPFRTRIDTTTRLDGSMLIAATARFADGTTISASALVTVDNLSFRMTPAVLNLRAKGRGVVVAHVDGAGAGGLLPVGERRVRLLVPGGSPVPAAEGWTLSGRSGGKPGASDPLLISFDRVRLTASIRAGMAAGQIGLDAAVQLVLVAEDDAIVGTALLRIQARKEW